MSLDKAAILDACDLPTEEVEVPEWNGSVFVRSMRAVERDSLEVRVLADGERNMANIRATFCARCIVDEEGERLFSDKDIPLLGNKSAAALDRIFAVVQRLNGLTADDVEELAKNLPDDQDSSSPSP